MNRLFGRVQAMLVFIADWLKSLLGRNRRDFASQRMCPFCGLITSRSKTCCLECGKLLKPA